MTDQQLLRQFLDEHAPAAFEHLVRRHAPLVHQTARRLAEPDVEDVAQAVFLLLAQKAHRLRHLPDLAGWLYRTTRYCASNARRTRNTRQRHEREAAMRRLDNQPACHGGVRDVLDDALSHLNETYRQTILLRYLEGLSLQETAERLQIGAAAVAKRAERGLEKMRRFLAAQGHVLPETGLCVLLAGEAAPDLPGALLQRLLQTGHGAAAPAGVLALGHGAGAGLLAGKIIAALAATVLIAGGAIATGIALTQGGAPPAARAAPNAAAAAPAVEPNSRPPIQRLSEIYRLAEGKNLRKITPPFPPERHADVDARYPYANGSDNVRSVGYRWTGQLDSSYMSYVDPTLRSVIRLGLRIDWYQVDRLDRIEWRPGMSDWIVREPLPVSDRLAALAELISAETGTHVRFERRIVRRPCIVLRGPVELGPDNGRRFHIVAVAPEPLSPDELQQWIDQGRSGGVPKGCSQTGDFQDAAEVLDAPFFTKHDDRDTDIDNNHFYISRAVRLRRSDPDYAKKLQRVLDNIKAQIGGEWSIEDRDIETWEAITGQ